MGKVPAFPFLPSPPGRAAMAWKKKKDKLPLFVPIFKEMLKSAAWEAIGLGAKVAYIHIKGKCFSNSPGEVSLSYKEMERIMERRTFSRALKELEQYGFITRTQRGGLYRRRNYFRLNEKWRDVRLSSGKSDTVVSGNNDTV